MRALPLEQQKALPRIIEEGAVRRLLADGKIAIDQLRPAQRSLIEGPPSIRYPEVALYWCQMEDLKRMLEALPTSTNESLNRQRVRLSGYLLPLELDGGKVSEFLLVPFVGACIHVPPLPPNQIVHVAMSGSYSAQSLYAPVRVTGTLSSSQGRVNLFLEDGTAPVERGYRLDAETVEAVKAR